MSRGHREYKASLIEREIGNRRLRKILVLSEGKQTEPNYFNAFPLGKKLLEVKGTGSSCVGLVEEAVRRKYLAEDSGSPYIQVWSVFDKDTHTNQEIREAVEKARKHKIRVAYSIEAFELWFILHFELLQAGIPRAEYAEKLSKHLNQPYDKNSRIMYRELLANQTAAIRNARRLLSSFPQFNNPSTTVHELVLELNKFI